MGNIQEAARLFCDLFILYGRNRLVLINVELWFRFESSQRSGRSFFRPHCELCVSRSYTLYLTTKSIPSTGASVEIWAIYGNKVKCNGDYRRPLNNGVVLLSP